MKSLLASFEHTALQDPCDNSYTRRYFSCRYYSMPTRHPSQRKSNPIVIPSSSNAAQDLITLQNDDPRRLVSQPPDSRLCLSSTVCLSSTGISASISWGGLAQLTSCPAWVLCWTPSPRKRGLMRDNLSFACRLWKTCHNGSCAGPASCGEGCHPDMPSSYPCPQGYVVRNAFDGDGNGTGRSRDDPWSLV
jgi:hypothetical protein